MNEVLFQEISTYLENHYQEMVDTLEEVVNIESYSLDVEGVTNVAKHFKKRFEEEGFTCHLQKMKPNGPTLTGVLGKTRKKAPILFSGHYDTVIKPGQYNKPVFTQNNHKAFGPGVLDMKGGIVIALYTIKALTAAGYSDRPLKIAFSGDEEIGHLKSEGAKALTKAAEGCVCAFNLETGLIDNSLCYGRKGSAEAHVEVTGIGAHAGNDFLQGRNAVAEMAEKIIRIQKITDLNKGTTVSCGVIEGGTVPNAIPEKCYLKLECRYQSERELLRFKKELEEIVNTSYIGKTTATVTYPLVFSPYERTENVVRFWEFIKNTANKYGLEEVRGTYLGGSSDAAYMQKAGVPVICAVGIQGQWNHTIKEYALLDSLVTRSKLLAATILDLNHFDNV